MQSLTSGTIGIAMATVLAFHSANAADVRLLSAAVIKPVTDVLAPPYEQATKNKLVARFDTGPAVLKLIESGEVIDVAIAPPSLIDALIKSGKIAGSSRTLVAQLGLGIGIRSGALIPDVSSAAALKQTLLNSKSVGYIGAGYSAPIVMALLERLGISNAMKSKLRPDGIDENLVAVANGAVGLVILPVPLIIATKGVELAGGLPLEFQDYIVIAAGVATAAPQSAAGQAFIQHLMSNDADKVFKAKGFERVAQ